MTSEAITTAIRSVLGDDTSPETIAALDAALRPIYGREAADIASKRSRASCNAIRTAFGVTDNG